MSTVRSTQRAITRRTRNSKPGESAKDISAQAICLKPPLGSKWSFDSWRQVSARLGRNPTEAEWELYQKGKL
jgi:hypothetical protein